MTRPRNKKAGLQNHEDASPVKMLESEIAALRRDLRVAVRADTARRDVGVGGGRAGSRARPGGPGSLGVFGGAGPVDDVWRIRTLDTTIAPVKVE